MINKEYGSDFHYSLDTSIMTDGEQGSYFLSNHFSLHFSGRSALYAIIEKGIKSEGWQKLYLPSFYCHEVKHFLENLPITICYYEFNPFIDKENKDLEIADINTIVIVNVDFFGLIKLSLVNYKNAIILDDQTHNLLEVKKSTAAYCFGSLRKELPMPLGGFVFSPKNYPLPKYKHQTVSEEIALKKLTAMYLKKEYLEGNPEVDKNTFRNLFQSAECAFEIETTNSTLPELAKAVLKQLDVDKIISIKESNLQLALLSLKDVSDIRVNLDKKNNAFGLILECESKETRDNLKNYLVEKKIFPAILWPNQLSPKDIETEGKILFIHVDYRYNTKDILFITKTIKDFFDNE